jgi:Na+-transporting NADH:ubiquinone oxidoreductase subunit B
MEVHILKEFYKGIFMKQNLMRTVLISLIPIIIFSTYVFGIRVLVLLSIVTLTGTIAEYLWEKHYKNKTSEAVFVSCVLYTLTLPVSIPIWIAVLGILFGLFFGKLFFGGFGKNIFNPAIVGRIFIYVNFPEPLTTSWNHAASVFPGGFNTYITGHIDAISEATPMILFNNTMELYDIHNLITGIIPGAIGETAKILIILAAIFLIYNKVASWEIMTGTLIGFLLTSTVFYLLRAPVLNPLYGILMGGFLFGTVFMATDPISAPKTKTGKWIYGIIIGSVTLLIRSMSLFNGGMMFAILMGNTFAPIIDYFVKENASRKKRKLEALS